MFGRWTFDGEGHGAVLSYRDHELYCDDRSLTWLADELPTPFFLFSERQVRLNFSRIQRALSPILPETSIDFCVKANDEPGILRMMRPHELGAMVTCGRELALALQAGFEPQRISFHTHCKARPDLSEAVSRGVKLFHVYSGDELEQLGRIADELHKEVRVSIRLGAPGAWWRRGWVGWYARRLGIPWSEAAGLYRRISGHHGLRPSGFSVHLGTQITAPDKYRRAVRLLMKLAAQLDSGGTPVREITLGGGWPSGTLRGSVWKGMGPLSREPGLPDDAGALESQLARTAASFRREAKRYAFSVRPSLRIEPGRGLVGQAGLLVTRVLAVRGRWVFVDATRNVLPESMLVANRAILPAKEAAERGLRQRFISGSALNTMDVLAAGVKLPALRTGDVLVFLDAGAYSLSRASDYAGSMPRSYVLRETGDIDPLSPIENTEGHG
jgi:diaminopimelate decarboxylase